MEAQEHEWMLRIALNSYIDDLTATLRADKRLDFVFLISNPSMRFYDTAKASLFTFRIYPEQIG